MLRGYLCLIDSSRFYFSNADDCVTISCGFICISLMANDRIPFHVFFLLRIYFLLWIVCTYGFIFSLICSIFRNDFRFESIFTGMNGKYLLPDRYGFSLLVEVAIVYLPTLFLLNISLIFVYTLKFYFFYFLWFTFFSLSICEHITNIQSFFLYAFLFQYYYLRLHISF